MFLILFASRSSPGLVRTGQYASMESAYQAYIFSLSVPSDSPVVRLLCHERTKDHCMRFSELKLASAWSDSLAPSSVGSRFELD